ncbi:MAG: FAD:protein FMN transferase [Planctomycetota bacterium]
MRTTRLATHAMGCRFELLLGGDDAPSLRAAGEEAIEEIEAAHRRLTAFESDSVVSRINAGAGVSAQRVDDELLELFCTCEQVRIASDGAFDVTVGRVMEMHGYKRSSGTDSTPSEAARTGPLVIDGSSGTVGLSDPNSSVDLGGVGKGFALDIAAQTLRESAVGSAFVHAGTSSVTSIGRRPDGALWRVSLPHDREGGAVSIELGGVSLSVSGTEEQGGHVVDPREGVPSENRRAVAVIGPSAAACDAWSTACFVLGGRAPGMPDEYLCWVQTEESWAVRSPST